MKALSLWQPWASLFAHGEKKIETRGWETKHRGVFLVHAALHRDREQRRLALQGDFAVAFERLGLDARDLPVGVLLGRVTLLDCVPTEKLYGGLSEQERSFGNYSPGRFGWICEGFRPFEKPIPHKGFQKLFNVDEDAVRDAFAAVRP